MPGEADETEATSGEFLRSIEEEAVERWGVQMWDSHHQVWAAAHQSGDDLLQSWAHLVERVKIGLPASDIADSLAVQIAGAPGGATVVAVNQAEANLGHRVRSAVADELKDRGFAGMVLLPKHRSLASLITDPAELLRAGSAAAIAGNRMALAISSALGQRRG